MKLTTEQRLTNCYCWERSRLNQLFNLLSGNVVDACRDELHDVRVLQGSRHSLLVIHLLVHFLSGAVRAFSHIDVYLEWQVGEVCHQFITDAQADVHGAGASGVGGLPGDTKAGDRAIAHIYVLFRQHFQLFQRERLLRVLNPCQRL